MLKSYDRWDSILMPLHVADPLYLSFEKRVLPVAVERGMGIQGMKNFCNAKLLQTFSVKECLSLRPEPADPLHGRRLHDHRPARGRRPHRARRCEPLDAARMAALRKRAEPLKGPRLEDWKEDITPKVGLLHRPATPAVEASPPPHILGE